MTTLDAKYYQDHSSFQKSVAETLISHYSFQGDEDILDIGCGEGYLTAKLAQCSPKGETTGIDPSASMIEFAKLHYPKTPFPNLSFQIGSAEDLHREAAYDVITAFSCLHWVPGLPLAFARIHQALKPSGHFLGITYPRNSPYWQNFIDLLQSPKWQQLYPHSACVNWLTTSEYKSIIHQAGFQMIRFDEIEDLACYESKDSLASYIKGWLPCLTSFSSDAEQNDFIKEFLDLTWSRHLDEKGGCQIPFIKLELVLRK